MYYARRIDNGLSYFFILLTSKSNDCRSEFKSILKSASYPVVETKSEGSVDEGDTGDDTALFLFAFLVTFAVVLLPPILYRKYKTTEPLEKKPAIIFSVVYFIVWAIVFEALGPENKFSVGILWTFFVYAVLRSPKINSKIKQIPDEIVMSTDLSDADEKDEPNMSEDVDSSFVADEKDEPNMSEDINSSFDDSMDYSSCETGQNVDGITLFVDENTESDNQE